MNADFFVRNRNKLVHELQGGITVLGAHTKMQLVSDMAAQFKQEPNFFYLCGIQSPDWLLVIVGHDESFLIAPDIDEVHQVFDGSLSNESATEMSGVRRIYTHDEGMRQLRMLAKKHSVVYTIDQPGYASHYDFSLNPSVGTTKRMLERIFTSVKVCNKELSQLRAIKQPEEIRMIRDAVRITTDAFQHVKDVIDSFKYEYEIEAEFTYAFRKRGGDGHAYEPIVASAKNACTLHYVANRDKLQKKNFVLMDIGASVNGYAADITRTYAYGSTTKRKADVHAAVQTAHKKIITLLKPQLSVEAYHTEVEAIMKQALDTLGLYKGEKSLRKYFPHAISHGLGIDVHDSLGAPRHFVENMVLTVEPGIYIPEEGIGVRIEDDILVTASGHENLSRSLSTDF